MKGKISLKFGKKKLNFLPHFGSNLGTLASKTYIPPVSEKEIVLQAINKPLNSDRPEKLITPGERILIIIPDKTRLCRIKIVLPLVLNILKRLKVEKKNIKIIFANGSHAQQTDEEKRKIIGSAVFSAYEVLENNAFNPDDHVKFGRTKAGTDIFLNKILLNTDKIITIGAVIHHYFAGFGGGAKLLMPGIAYYKTIESNHKKSILRTGKMNPNCRTACLDGNPIYEEIAEVIKFVPPVFSICLVMNESGKIINAKCGNPITAHKKAADLVNKYYKIKIRNQADLVIVSAGGYPKDIDFIQSHKSIQNAFAAVKENGVIISIAECKDGIGSKTFNDWFKYETKSEFKNALLKNYSLNAQTALSLKSKLEKVKIILVSSLPKETVEYLGLNYAKNIEDALEYAVTILGNKFTYYIIKNGSLAFPEITNRQNYD